MRVLMKGLTDAEFDRRYGTEQQCLEVLVAARRKAGIPRSTPCRAASCAAS